MLLSKADYFWRLNITGDRTRQTIADLKVGEFLVGPSESDPNTQISDFIGSGPFVFQKDEWKPGDKAVYVKFAQYKPRSEPASGLAGPWWKSRTAPRPSGTRRRPAGSRSP